VVWQQCRSEDLDRVRAIYFDNRIKSELSSFFEDVPARLGAAHLVIGRSGASTVSELAVAGRPSILVPYQAAADDHQTDNARVLEKSGGALVVAQARFTAEQLGRQLQELFADPALLAAMAKNAAAIGHPDATIRLADLVENMAPGKSEVAARAAA
jgi:UDP-N-acetylglucosamine--N-acetylmuramyl-(pentapeptide) pyrophosphoryl-undecaprenol N-acetylglucosamine transferase